MKVREMTSRYDNCLLKISVSDTETITALFRTNFDFEIPFDLEELPAFALIG